MRQTQQTMLVKVLLNGTKRLQPTQTHHTNNSFNPDTSCIGKLLLLFLGHASYRRLLRCREKGMQAANSASGKRDRPRAKQYAVLIARSIRTVKHAFCKRAAFNCDAYR
jgi:hypothetical protein